jgi:hypothetical protein
MYNSGGIYNVSHNLNLPPLSVPALVNVDISGNTAITDGGGMYNNNSSPVLTNVTIAGNYAGGNGGGILNNDSNSNPQIRNSIIWGNTSGIDNNAATPVISYSIVQGGFTGGEWNGSAGTGSNNLDANPNFISLVPAASGSPVTAGDYRLLSGSPAIDRGNNVDYPNTVSDIVAFLVVPLTDFSAATQAAINMALTTDPKGNPRKVDGDSDSVATIDMGAYE